MPQGCWVRCADNPWVRCADNPWVRSPDNPGVRSADNPGHGAPRLTAPPTTPPLFQLGKVVGLEREHPIDQELRARRAVRHRV